MGSPGGVWEREEVGENMISGRCRPRAHLPQRMTLKSIICHDSSQIRVTEEENTEQIPNLSLVPIGGSENTSGTGNRGHFIRVRLDSDARVELDTEEVVDDFESLRSSWVVGS